MERQALHRGPVGDPRTARRRPAAQQLERGVERVARRRFEPREAVADRRPTRARRARRPRDRCGGSPASRVRPQPVRARPQPPDRAWPNTSRAAGPLIRRVLRDALDLEAVDRRAPDRSAPPCAARCRRRRARPARSATSRRCWSRGSPAGARASCSASSCSSAGSAPCSGTTSTERAGGDRRDLRRGTADLGSARQKTEHVPSGLLEGARHDRRATPSCRRVVDLERMRPAGHRDRRTAIEIRGDGVRLQRRRHHDDPQIVARQPRLPRRARGRGPRGCCARGTRRGRPSGNRRAADPAAAARSGCLRSPAAPACPAGTAARSGRASRLRGRASSRVRPRCAARSTAPRRAAAAAR